MKSTPQFDKIQSPGAGQGFSWVPSTRDYWRVRSLIFTLTTGITVSNRSPSLEILATDGTVVWEDFTQQTEPASSVFTVMASDESDPASAISTTVGNQMNLALPNFWLPPLWSLSVTAFNIAATDQISGIVAMYEVYDEDSDRQYWQMVADQVSGQ